MSLPPLSGDSLNETDLVSSVRHYYHQHPQSHQRHHPALSSSSYGDMIIVANIMIIFRSLD